MNFRTAFLFAAILSVPIASSAQPPSLKFVKQIGVGWQTDLWKIQKWGWMSFVAFKSDGTMIASDASTAPDDVSGNLTLWSIPEGRLIKKFSFPAVAISNDWKYYANLHGVGEVETGRSLISVVDNVYPIFAFTPDSRYVAESLPGKDIHHPHIRIIELSSGKQVSAFGGYRVFSIAISPDGMTLAAGHWNVVTLWNRMTGRQVAVLKGLNRYVDSLAFSKDGKLLAAGNDLGDLQIWDIQHQVKLQSIHIDGQYVSEPAFSPEGKSVAVGIYGTGTVFLIDVVSGKILDHQQVSDIGCGSVAFSPDGSFLITPSTGGLIKWPYDRGGTIRVFKVNAP
jgi:WD40 repeat protein